MPFIELTSAARDRIRSIDGKWDTHIHTDFAEGDKSKTPDLNSVNVIKEAEAVGLEGFVFCDHVRADTPWVADYEREVRSLAEGSRVQILLGIETKIKENLTLDAPAACLSGKWWVTASIHTFRGGKKEWVEAIYSALAAPAVTALGHLGTQYNGVNSGEIKFDLEDAELEKLAKAVKKSGKFVELNARHQLPRPRWVQFFREAGVNFCLASDSHSPKTVGRFKSIEHLVKAAR